MIIAKIALFAFLLHVSVRDVRQMKISNSAHAVIILFSIILYKIPLTERFLTCVAVLAALILLRKSVGAGDIKLCGAIGFSLGTDAFLALFIGFAGFSAAAGIRQMQGKIRSAYPFAPFLCAGFAVVAAFAARKI